MSSCSPPHPTEGIWVVPRTDGHPGDPEGPPVPVAWARLRPHTQPLSGPGINSRQLCHLLSHARCWQGLLPSARAQLFPGWGATGAPHPLPPAVQRGTPTMGTTGAIDPHPIHQGWSWGGSQESGLPAWGIVVTSSGTQTLSQDRALGQS